MRTGVVEVVVVIGVVEGSVELGVGVRVGTGVWYGSISDRHDSLNATLQVYSKVVLPS